MKYILLPLLCVALPLMACLVTCAQTTPVTAGPPKTNEPDFGPNVLIFDPSTPDIQTQVSAVFTKMEKNQFGTDRYALLFKPGKYNLDVQVGFYTSVLGLGKSPDDVAITGAVRAKAGWKNGNATVNFWRSVENLSVVPTQDGNAEMWAISQGTAFRRVHVIGDMKLDDGGNSSGGFIADSVIDGHITSGSQQQFMSRNDAFGNWTGQVWNMVFVGTKNAPKGNWPNPPYTVIPKTPLMREKPYLTYSDGHYFVTVPDLATDTAGATWTTEGGVQIPIEKFYLAHPATDTAATINAAINAGQDILLTPGVYSLDAPIKVAKPNIIILGLGYPTLTAANGTACIAVSDVDGVKIAGLLCEAGATESPTLIQVGDPGSNADHKANPTFLYDIFCRAGGAVAGATSCFVTVNSNNSVIDNTWLWRADHGAGAKWDVNKNLNGLIVNGNDVTCYGLFVEHCQAYQTLWNGEGGRVYFYQSEMPYDPPSQDAWSHDGVNGYASYKVADTVKTHEAYGLGVYCVFRNRGGVNVVADNAFEAPTGLGIQMHHLMVDRIRGTIKFLINGTIPCNGTTTDTPF